MTVIATDFIEQAKKVLKADEHEISIRCSIKNSYYAAYHHIHSILKSPIPRYMGMGAHQGFITYLSDEAYRFEKDIPKIKLRKFGIILGQLKAQRHKADYDLECTLSQEHAQIQLTSAQKIITEANELLKKIPPEFS